MLNFSQFCAQIPIINPKREKVIAEAKQILDVEKVIASILLVEDLRIQKN